MRRLYRLGLTLTALLGAACNGGGLGGGAAGDGGGAPPLAQRPAIERPPPGVAIRDPLVGARLTRMSDSSRGPSIHGRPITRIEYARVQPENADGSRVLVQAVNAERQLQFGLMASDGGEIELLDLPPGNPSGREWLSDETEPRWHPSDPARIRFIAGQNSFQGSLRVYEYHLGTHQVTVLSDLNGKLPAHWQARYGMTHLEGRPSDDGNRYAWSIEDGNEQSVGYVAFDIRDGGRVLGTLDYDGRDHDNITISPSGEYVVISAAAKTAAYPVDFSREQVIQRETEHGDTCTDAAGRDCYVTVSFTNADDPDNGWVFSVDLASGRRTRLVDVYGLGNTSLHLSGTAGAARPGWLLLSTYGCKVGDEALQRTRLCGRVFLLENAADGVILPLAWTHASGSDYFAEPHASFGRDGSRAWFNADWQGAGQAIDVYRLDIDPVHYAR